jgi:hypothetical protein
MTNRYPAMWMGVVLSLAAFNAFPHSGRDKSPAIQIDIATIVNNRGRFIYSKKFNIFVDENFERDLWSPKNKSPNIINEEKMA